ncbi:hypothetical protein P7H12_00090 [Paenibacillus larvae]|nr:hypothetical protein [Paenibacillus larvae]MDT2262372.1 hypothetical protein [Paenibacillus larvae]
MRKAKTGALTTMQLLRLADAGGPVSSTSLMRGLQKRQAHVALKVAVEKIIEYELSVFVVETVGAQFDMYRQIQEELSRLKIY